jgi:hypothetical protein
VGVSGLIALYQDGRKLTVKDVVERNALLTEQLAKERAEVQTGRQTERTDDSTVLLSLLI